MKKGLKTSLIVIATLVVVALLSHLTMNFLIPLVVEMHSSGSY